MKKLSSKPNRLASLALLINLLLSCSLTPERQQGNILDPTEVKKINIGSSQAEVIQLIGEPLLVHILDKNIWIYTYQKKVKNSEAIQSQHLILKFSPKGRIVSIKSQNLDFTAKEATID